MATITIPAPLHDVFGDRQSPASLALIVLAMPLAVIAVWPALSAVELWRAALAAVLVADIAAGAVANVTRGTNDHYAASARRRTVFLAVHVHLPVVALLLDLPLLPALVAWALTIIAATLVVLLGQSTLQRPVAAVGVIAVLSVTALFSETSTVLLLVTGLFAIKVVLSFAVDHNRVAGP
jgi:hypothetical protein